MHEVQANAAGSDTGLAPIRRSVTVEQTVADAFRLFTEEMGAWWPLESHSRAADEREGDGVTAVGVVLEPRAGGRLYEVMSDGTEASWGQVLVWKPPHRLVLAWKPHARPTPPTEVEVTFEPDGDGTRVDLEHRAWDRLGHAAVQGREGYASGWIKVLGRYQAASSPPAA